MSTYRIPQHISIQNYSMDTTCIIVTYLGVHTKSIPIRVQVYISMHTKCRNMINNIYIVVRKLYLNMHKYVYIWSSFAKVYV